MSDATEHRAVRLIDDFVYAVGVALAIYLLYYAYYLPVQRLRFSNHFLGAALVVFYLRELTTTLSEPFGVEVADETTDESGSSVTSLRDRLPDAFRSIDEWVARVTQPLRRSRSLHAGISLGSAVLVTAGTVYVELNFVRLEEQAHIVGFRPMDYVVGVVLLVIVIDATRRAFGNAIALFAVVAVVYSLYGPWFPGVLHHSSMEWQQVTRNAVIGLNGLYGFILGVGVTWVAIFIVFAGMAKAYGLMDFIEEISDSFKSYFDTGVVQLAVVASMIMGSITGSAAANTATTGSFTIPVMKRQGVRSDFAAAIESVASSGGQLMPPIMGIAAFLMADFLNLPYVRIIQAALIPALIFYFSVFVAVQFVVLKHDWTPDVSGTFEPRLLLKGVHFIVPFSVLIYTLVILRLSPLSAGLYTSLSLIGVMYLRNLAGDGVSVRTVRNTTKQTLDGFATGVADMAPLVAVLGALGIILNLVQQTGLAQKISFQMVALSGGILVLLLILSMLTSILFGLGMPTPAAYVLVVALVAPAMIEIGIQELVAHMYVFYFALLSAITPPVAVAVAVGAKVAETDFLTAAKQALRIGAPGFLIPYVFVANQSLIYWSLPMTPIKTVIALVSIVGLVTAIIGYNGSRTIGYPRRALYLVASLVGMVGPFAFQLPVAGMILAPLLWHRYGRDDTPNLRSDRAS